MRLTLFVLLLGILGGTNPAVAQTSGPEKGILIIVGGGRMSPDIVDEFIASAGGVDAPFVIVPTALEGEDWGPEYVAHSFLGRPKVCPQDGRARRYPQTFPCIGNSRLGGVR